MISRKFRILIVFVIISQFVLFEAFAQIKSVGIPDIKNFKRTEYKGATQNWDIDQDKNGNLYFANNSGLFQYDGSSWTKYNLPSTTSIRSLKIDVDGKIFVGGYNEFGYFQSDDKGILKYFSVSKFLDNKKNPIDFIWKIHIFQGEIIFQSFQNLYIYSANKLKVIKAPTKFQFSFLVDNQLFIQDKSEGLLKFRDGEFHKLGLNSTFSNTEIWGMFPIENNKILISTIDKGLFILENNKVIPWKIEANEFIQKNNSLGGINIKNEFIVLNSVLDGIIICDQKGKIIQHINQKKGLQNNTVLSSFVDIKNNIWLGLDNGIAFINENSPFTYFGSSYQLSTVYASVVYKKNLYVATNQGVFYHPWGKDFKEDSFVLVKGTTGQAWNIQLVNGNLICGHNRGAILIFDNNNSQILDNKGYWNFKNLPNKPDFIIGSNYNGFALFEKTSNGLKYVNQISGYNKSVNSFEIENNFLWFNKDGNIYKLELSNDLKSFNSIKNFDKLSNVIEGVGNVHFINNKVLFQNKFHFYNFSYDNNMFYKNDQINKLFDKISGITKVTQDQLGNIWYVYDESLGVLMKLKDGSFKNNYSTFASLKGNLVSNYESINCINSYNIFIGMIDGLAHFNPKSANYYSNIPKVFIKSFSFPNENFVLGNLSQKHKNINISYAANNVKFTFSSPIYDNQQKVEFSYQLENFDEKWSSWSVNNIKEYTNLREGNYLMKLKVRNSFGIQSKPTSVSFSVSPPWYRSILAYLIYIILIGLIVYFIRMRIQIKIRKNKYYETIEQRKIYLEKEAKIKQEQFELEKEIEILKNEKLQIKILSKDKELVNNSLQVVKKNKILNGIIVKLKDIDSVSFDESTKFQFNKLNKSIVKEVHADKSWQDLEKHIKNVHFDFLKRLKEKYPTITPRELDLSTYLLMNMSTKEIAEIMNISGPGVELARYRLRKKLELNKKENLTGFLMGI